MNSLETKYSIYLGVQKGLGEILDYAFEPIKIRLADRTYYSPDFMVVNTNHEIELHEVKATWSGKPHYEDDAIVKLKVAAESLPFTFKMVWLDKEKGWVHREF